MLYQKIARQIEQQITLKTLTAGEKLASIRQLATDFACSKNTVIKALSELEKKHLIYSIPKQGFFVAKPTAKSAETNSVIDFLFAEPDPTTIQADHFQHCAEQVLENLPQHLLSYGQQSGLPRLKKNLIPYFQDQQIFTTPERLVITTGSQQAIDILMNMPFPNKREKILIEQPTYFGALNSANLSGKDILGIQVENQQLDLNRLEYIFKNNEIKFFYVMARFHNPLGHSYSQEVKRALVELANKYDVYLVEDDYLGDLELDSKSDPLFSFDPSGRVIYVKSFSKIFLPGLRLGTVILPEQLLPTFLEYKFCRDFATPVFSQELLATFIENGMFQNHLKTCKKLYPAKMKSAQESCQKYLPHTVTYTLPETGFYFSLGLPEGIRSQDLTAALKLKNILVDDIARMYLPHVTHRNMIRLSISKTSAAEIDYGIQEIAATIAELSQQRQSVFKSYDLYI